jgi:hypothetical protein
VGLPGLDAILPGGGVPCGHVTELAGPPSCGKLSIATCLLVSVLGGGGRGAFVDGGRVFFPGLSAEVVRSLAGLLVCRVEGAENGIAAAELLAESGVFEGVVVDLAVRGGAPGANRTALARPERAARQGETAVVVVTEPPRGAATVLGGAAALRLEVTPGSGRWAGLVESRVRVGRSRFGTTGTTAIIQRSA